MPLPKPPAESKMSTAVKMARGGDAPIPFKRWYKCRKVGACETAKPVAWIRFCSDGCYEGPIMDEQIEDVRKNSGAWTPLYARHNAG
jgi:hypothetical protein